MCVRVSVCVCVYVSIFHRNYSHHRYRNHHRRRRRRRKLAACNLKADFRLCFHKREEAAFFFNIKRECSVKKIKLASVHQFIRQENRKEKKNENTTRVHSKLKKHAAQERQRRWEEKKVNARATQRRDTIKEQVNVYIKIIK